MQRVKALLTGSLPTFLDVGSVFAGGQIQEDNVLLQAMRNGMRVGAVGDDTWTQLFPPASQGALNLSHPYPSLNVHDLDTVDDGVSAVRLSPSPQLRAYTTGCVGYHALPSQDCGRFSVAATCPNAGLERA